MSLDKYSEIKIGIVLISALAIGGYRFLNVDGIVFVGVVIALLLCGYAIGINEGNKKYKSIHYSILEHDAKERREKDEKLWKEAKDAVREYNEKHS